MNLGDLNEAQRDTLLSYYSDYSKIALLLQQWGIQTTPESARRTMRNWRSDDDTPPQGNLRIINAPQRHDTQHNLSQFLDRTRHTERYARVMHLCDVHFPYHDETALQLAYRVVAEVQPHVIVIGSDTFDFQYLSKFDSDPDVTQYDDEIELAESYWNPHIHAIKDAAPNARLIYIYGNHERRLIKHLNSNSPKLRRRVMNSYEDMVRCGGAVEYIGYVDRVWIANLLVQHGNRHGQYYAKAHLQDLAFQAHTMMGHVHRLDSFQVMGARHMAKSAGSGCLCQLQPHYVKGTQMRRKWMHGTCIADLDLISGDVDFHNLTFTQDGQRMQTRLGFNTLAVDMVEGKRKAA